jgi:hypothetical protein
MGDTEGMDNRNRSEGSLNLHFFSRKAQTVCDPMASEKVNYSRMVSRTYFYSLPNEVNAFQHAPVDGIKND